MKKTIDISLILVYNRLRCQKTTDCCGSIAQLGEHLPYKQGVTGSSPVVPTTFFGPVVQLVRTLACHARGRQFEPDPGRHYASVAQSVEQGTENPRVIGSIPIGGTIVCGRSSSGRAPPCQGGGSEFEPRRPLQTNKPLQNMIRRVMQRLFCTLKAFLELEKEGKTQ